MIGKPVYLLTVLVSIVAVANTESLQSHSEDKTPTVFSHHLIVGARQPGDCLVVTLNVVKPSKWFQIITVEQSFKVSSFERITQIRAFDQDPSGNGATASLVSGGPGNGFATLRFQSRRGHGINFVVEAYAR